MTGLANDGSYLHVRGSDYYGDPLIQRFSTAGSTNTVYMDEFPGLGTAYDIAWISGGVWVARDDSDSPILAYDTGGSLVNYVDGTTVSAAMGLTMDDEGYLWASNPDDDIIYQLNVTTGISEGPTELPARTLQASENPFSSMAVITGSGFLEATIEIFDLSGRSVTRAPFTGSFTWSASAVPAGSYFAVVRDGKGISTLRLTRIN